MQRAPSETGSPPTGPDASSQSVGELQQKPLSAFPATGARPVFFEGRAYPPRAVAAAPAARPVPPAAVKHAYGVEGMQLLGIVANSGQSRALIASSTASGWTTVGDRVQNWTVDSIKLNSVRLVREGQTATLLLYGFSAEN